MKDDTEKYEDITRSGTRRINIVQMAILPEAINRLKADPAKHLFLKQVQIFLKFIESHTRPNLAKANVGKKETKNKVEATTLLDFRTNCKATEIQTAWYWHSNRHRAQWNRIEIPDMTPE